MGDDRTDVFVYGTLTDPDRAAAVLGEDAFAFAGEATLDGLHRVEGEYPTLAPGGEVRGRILRVADLAPVDRYEGVDRGLYVRVSVPVADGEGTVETYVGDPGRLDADAEWPGSEDPTFRAAVEAGIRREGVVVRRG
jgi:gamma-glutamylcyclotransferase (GGCT)/AIG2-like uncharacterized protein YtfP